MNKRLLLLLLFISSKLISQPVNLEVRAYAQGFYSSSSGTMIPVVDPLNYPALCDTATIFLVDSASRQSVYCDRNAFSIQGFGYSTLPSFIYGNRYLVGVRFRNTLSLVSLNTVLFDSTDISVDLSIPSNVCCAADTSGGIALAYSGDVNDDGSIDGNDLSQVYNDNTSMLTGYVLTDLNGDGIVDSTDVNLVSANSTLFLFDEYFALCSSTGISTPNSKKLNAVAFPNPFREQFTIRLSQVEQEVLVTVYDIYGKVCSEKSFYNTMKIEMDALPSQSGIYFIDLRAGQKSTFLRMIQMK